MAIYNAQKKKREQDIEIMHNCILFKNLSRKYFNTKVFSTFKIKNAFKGNVLVKQYETLHNFIFIKEGILELSLQNASFNEFHQLIKEVKEILIKKSKELKMNQKDLFDFETEVDSKTNLHINTLKGILNQKQTFLFHRNENGSFGDYEFFFDIPTILTVTVVSDKCLYYNYDIEKYKQLIQETYLLNESLRNNSFLKLKSLLKRMISVYNSYWHLSLEQLEKKLKEKEDMYYNEKNNEDKELSKKNLSLTKKINKIPFLNINATNRYSYNNLSSVGGESPFNNKRLFKGIENSNFNTFKFGNLNDRKSLAYKFQINNNTNRNLMNAGKRKLLSIYNKSLDSKPNREIKKSGNKTYILKDVQKKNETLIENNKIDDNEKKGINNYKVINGEEYKKKLIENFQHEMESQRVAKRKIAKKIFLPPITFFSPGQIKSPINFNEKSRNLKSKDIMLMEDKNTNISKRNSIKDKQNISLIINNSFSGNASKIMNENEETLNSNNESKIKSNINKKKKLLLKETNKKVNNLKIVQLYNIISRKEKDKKQ